MRKSYTRVPVEPPHPAFKKEIAMWVPMLQVRVGHNHQRTPRIPAVVDSGSPWCLFQADVADYLGIKVESGVESVVSGITRTSPESVYFHPVQLYVESDWIISVMAGFCKKLAVAAILGRNGFFENFRVKFDQSVAPPMLEVEKIDRTQ